jgi:hypothetical protein
MEYREIALESLLLDPGNPRHDPVTGQREAIDAFLKDRTESQQLLRLAKDIAENGPSPIDLVMVVAENGTFVVVEGNRRVLAMKLLKHPALAKGFKIEKAISEVSRSSMVLDTVRCMVATSRDDAKRWIELRHTGSQEGLGVVGWSPEMQVRFTQNYTGQRGRAYQLTDALREAYEGDRELLDLVRTVRTTNLTTLGRLANDPAFRAAAGIDIRGDEVSTRFPASAMRQFWYRLFTDLSTNAITARSLNKKEQRASYLNTFADVRPPAEARRPRSPLTAEPQPQPTTTQGTVPAAAAPRRPAARAQRPRPTRLFHGLELRNTGIKVRDVLREAQRLDLTQFPNAGAVLIRVLVELVVHEALEFYGLPTDGKLRQRVEACLRKLDPTNRNDRYEAVRKALSNDQSPIAVRSMHAYLHNPYMQPDAGSLRAISENYMPLLADLDNAI